MKLCPCGYLGDMKHNCSCTPTQIQRYGSRMSWPPFDRIDLHLEVPPAIKFKEMTAETVQYRRLDRRN